MPKRISFTTADKVGNIPLNPTHRLTLLSDERKHEMVGPLNPMNEQARQQKMHSFIGADIKNIDDSSLLMTRIGAYVFLFSQIENRVRAMYRQRFALMMGKPAPTTTDEDNYEPLDEKVEKHDLKKAALLLRNYEDIDTDLAEELVLFTEVRNKLVHQTLYRTEAFKADAIQALIELYTHLVRVRARLTTRLKKERKLYDAPSTVQSIVRHQLADIPFHKLIPRNDIFERTGVSPTVNVPIIAGQPLYLVAKTSKKHEPLQVSIADEAEHHTLWDTIIQSKTPYVLLHKHNKGHDQMVKRIGEGVVTSAEYDSKGKYKLLNIQLIS